MEKIKNLILSKPLENFCKRIEGKAKKEIEVIYEQSWPIDKGQSCWKDGGKPCIIISEKGTTLEVVGHELLHLELRIKGYPDKFSYTFPWVGRLDNLLQHYVIFSQYVNMKLDPKKFVNAEAKSNMRQILDDFLLGKINLTNKIEKLRIGCYSFMAISEFYGYDEKEKQVLKNKITWQKKDFWDKWNSIVKMAKKDGKKYVCAFREACNLIEINDIIEPIYIKF